MNSLSVMNFTIRPNSSKCCGRDAFLYEFKKILPSVATAASFETLMQQMMIDGAILGV